MKTLKPFPTRIRKKGRRRTHKYFPETPTSTTCYQILHYFYYLSYYGENTLETMDLWALILSTAVTMSSIWTHLVFRKPPRLLKHSMIWDGRVRGGGSNFTEKTQTHNCCYITCLESLNQLLEVLDLNPGMILSLTLLPIYHADSIHNCQSVYLQNCHIKIDALPTYFRGVKHILIGFFFFLCDSEIPSSIPSSDF